MRTGTFSADDAARRQIPESRALCSTDDNRQYTVNDDVKQMTADSLADDVRLVRQTRSTVWLLLQLLAAGAVEDDIRQVNTEQN